MYPMSTIFGIGDAIATFMVTMASFYAILNISDYAESNTHSLFSQLMYRVMSSSSWLILMLCATGLAALILVALEMTLAALSLYILAPLLIYRLRKAYSQPTSNFLNYKGKQGI